MFDLPSSGAAQECQFTHITVREVLVTLATVPILAVLLPALGLSKAFWQCFFYTPACQSKEKAKSELHEGNRN